MFRYAEFNAQQFYFILDDTLDRMMLQEEYVWQKPFQETLS